MTIRVNQAQRIIDYINKYGSITSWEAYNDIGVTELHARINELRKKGYEFEDKWETNQNRFGENVNFKRYYLKNKRIVKRPNGIQRSVK